ncbi:MAG: DUF1501 domain-containing protein [Pseudomonadota bacterium]
MNRRHFLRLAGALPALSLLNSAEAAASDYRALVVLHLNGGNDGHNCLVPTDGAYDDYARARPGLALPKASLVPLAGSSAGHSFGMHPALASMAALYDRGRLAWIANTGALVAPASARQVMEHSVALPSFLLSHSDQTLWHQGWLGDADLSGWAGRALELLPGSLRHDLNAVSMSSERTLVQGRKSGVAFLSAGTSRHWGPADLAQPDTAATQTLHQMARWQFANHYEAEYAASFRRALNESTAFTQVALGAPAPSGAFADDRLAQCLRKLATMLPRFKDMGYRRQVFLVHWGNFDTHTYQRGANPNSQDAQLLVAAKALAAFDSSIQSAGLDQNVVTLSTSDFGRTLSPASGGGSDHAWGNHWFALGGPVAGGQVLGTFPTLVAGGPDDCDGNQGGRFVPTTSSDQVGASVMQWLGLPDSGLLSAFPHLANFKNKTLPHLLRS